MGMPPNGWFINVCKGKSQLNGWFRGTPYSRKPPIPVAHGRYCWRHTTSRTPLLCLDETFHKRWFTIADLHFNKWDGGMMVPNGVHFFMEFWSDHKPVLVRWCSPWLMSGFSYPDACFLWWLSSVWWFWVIVGNVADRCVLYNVCIYIYIYTHYIYIYTHYISIYTHYIHTHYIYTHIIYIYIDTVYIYIYTSDKHVIAGAMISRLSDYSPCWWIFHRAKYGAKAMDIVGKPRFLLS